MSRFETRERWAVRRDRVWTITQRVIALAILANLVGARPSDLRHWFGD
jgi:hypothetical protein